MCVFVCSGIILSLVSEELQSEDPDVVREPTAEDHERIIRKFRAMYEVDERAPSEIEVRQFAI